MRWAGEAPCRGRRVRAKSEDRLFLPDFCDLRVVFAMVVMGQLLALVLVLAPTRHGADWWLDLALASLFIQWVGLSSAGVLCVCRPWLARLSNEGAGVVGYLLVLLVAMLLSEAAYWLVAERIVSLDMRAARTEVPPGTWPVAAPGPGGEPLTAWHLEFLLRNVCISAIVGAATLRYLYVQHHWRNNIESEARARIQALQSRIRPHFLFNSMNTIASLARSQSPLAEQVTEDLAELFRASLGDASIPVELERELDFCRQYLRIEAQRLGHRISKSWDVDELPGDALLPRLTLQPLVENAVYHGIELAPEGGEIEIRGTRRDDWLVVCIENSCPLVPVAGARDGNHIAQENVAQRLEAFFGSKASLRVEAEAARYAVTLEFPYVRERSQS